MDGDTSLGVCIAYGHGGMSGLGGAGAPSVTNADGVSATDAGAGGGGVSRTSGGPYLGGAGGDGYVVIFPLP
jgi:hypothetical protein